MTKSRAKYFIREYYDRLIAKKELLRRRDQEIRASYIGKQFLIKNKIFTKSRLTSYEKKGLLTSIVYKGRKFFKKEEVGGIIGNERASKSAYQTSLFSKDEQGIEK